MSMLIHFEKKNMSIATLYFFFFKIKTEIICYFDFLKKCFTFKYIFIYIQRVFDRIAPFHPQYYLLSKPRYSLRFTSLCPLSVIQHL